jgi:hypothetical protein
MHFSNDPLYHWSMLCSSFLIMPSTIRDII